MPKFALLYVLTLKIKLEFKFKLFISSPKTKDGTFGTNYVLQVDENVTKMQSF